MFASELTFGIELETHVPRGTCQVGGYHVGTQVPFLPSGWTAQRDCSIAAPTGREGCEFVSPILKGGEGLKQVVAVAAKLNEIGAKVNASTGLHVHVGWAGDAAALDRLVNLVANFEKAIFAATGTKSREQSHYCQGIHQHGNRQTAETASLRDRYHVLNLTNLRNPAKQTVEFRAFAGSTKAVKVVGYIRLCLALVEKALNSKKGPQFTAKATKDTSPVHRAGEGYTQLARAFYALGWTKGRSDYVYGNVTAEGVPTLADCKKELVRLAKKYDGIDAQPETETLPEAGAVRPARRSRR